MSAPPNDNIANRIPISIGAVLNIDVSEATIESGEAALFGTSSYRSVWYEFTSAVTGMVGFEVFECDSPDYPPQWWIGTGTDMTDLVYVGSGTGPPSHADVVSGQTYLIRIAAQDELTNLITAQLRQYEWGEWTDQDDITLECALPFVVDGIGSDGTEGIFENTSSNAERVDLANTSITSQWGEMVSVHDGFDDGFFRGTTSGTADTTVHGSQNEWVFNVKATSGGEGSIDLQVDSSHRADVLHVGPAGAPQYFSDAATDYESSQCRPISGTVEVNYAYGKQQAEPSHPYSYSGHFILYSYVPTEIDSTVLAVGHHRHLLIDVQNLTDPQTEGSYTATFTEGDFDVAPATFAGSVPGVQFFAGVNCGAPDISTVPAGTDRGVRFFGNLTIDREASSWVVRPPRYRLLQLVPFSGGVAPPCQIYPRDDHQGAGTEAVWPPPSSGQPGSYY